MSTIVMFNVEEIFTLIKRDLFNYKFNGSSTFERYKNPHIYEYEIDDIIECWFFETINDYRILNLAISRTCTKIPREICYHLIREIHPAYARLLYKLIARHHICFARETIDLRITSAGQVFVTLE